jgi:hypothetical protein
MKFTWPESAQAELRAIDREIAIRILHALTEYGESVLVMSKRSRANGKATFEFESGTTVSSSRSRRMK